MSRALNRACCQVLSTSTTAAFINVLHCLYKRLWRLLRTYSYLWYLHCDSCFLWYYVRLRLHSFIITIFFIAALSAFLSHSAITSCFATVNCCFAHFIPLFVSILNACNNSFILSSVRLKILSFRILLFLFLPPFGIFPLCCVARTTRLLPRLFLLIRLPFLLRYQHSLCPLLSVVNLFFFLPLYMIYSLFPTILNFLLSFSA